MRRSVGSALAASLLLALLASEAKADGLGPGLKRLPSYARFENLDDFPEYRFYLRYWPATSSGPAQTATIIELPSRQPVLLASDTEVVVGPTLLAVPREQGHLAEQLGRDLFRPTEPAGVLRAGMRRPETAAWFGSTVRHYVTPFRVTFSEGKMDVKELPAEAVYPEEWRGRLLPYWPILLASALALAGAWLARRRSRGLNALRRAPDSDTPSE
jgi:hypothetical protein